MKICLPEIMEINCLLYICDCSCVVDALVYLMTVKDIIPVQDQLLPAKQTNDTVSSMLISGG